MFPPDPLGEHDHENETATFGAPPAYASGTALVGAVLSIVAGLGQLVLGVLDLNLGWLPGFVTMGVAFLSFVTGLVLLIRWIEARDAMTDPTPRVRLYDSRHEGRLYFLALALSVVAAGLNVSWRNVGGWGPWHLVPAALCSWAALTYLSLWVRRLRGG
jgi:hypothetical protein